MEDTTSSSIDVATLCSLRVFVQQCEQDGVDSMLLSRMLYTN